MTVPKPRATALKTALPASTVMRAGEGEVAVSERADSRRPVGALSDVVRSIVHRPYARVARDRH